MTKPSSARRRTQPASRRGAASRSPGRPASRTIDDTVALFAALANRVRLRLLVALARLGPMPAGDLQRLVGGEQSAVSHQLAALRRSRLCQTERRGRQIVYSLADQHVARIIEDALDHVDEVR
jgi:ArsR family transcriptional regulator, lead/cadmium/zinc/bismuth-responsive transcriptional repressor